MDKSYISRQIFLILNGSNYRHRVAAMRGYLKCCKIWRYLIYDNRCPQNLAVETNEQFSKILDDWDRKSHQIITWFFNTFISNILL
jgi:hypothetical protein